MRIAAITLPVLVALGGSVAEAQTWTVSQKPVITIGEVEGAPEYLFRSISHARRLSDGRILVITGTDLRFYDDKGKYLSKAGGRGGGPGEFHYIGDLQVLRGDTLLVLSELGPVWLTREGKYIRQEAIDYPKFSGEGWFMEQGSGYLLPNGQFLGRQFQSSPKVPTFYRPPYRYVILDRPTDTLKPLFTSGGYRRMVSGRGGLEMPQPFSPEAQHAIGADRIYLGDNDTTFMNVFALDGKPLGRIRIAEKAVPVTAQELSAYRESMLTRFGNNAQRKAEFERNWGDVEKPKRHPYWGIALVDRTGNLWISDHTGFRPLRRAPVAWTVFDRNGRRVATVTMPAGLQPKEIGSNYVLGVNRDEFDVEYVHMHTLSKAGR